MLRRSPVVILFFCFLSFSGSPLISQEPYRVEIQEISYPPKSPSITIRFQITPPQGFRFVYFYYQTPGQSQFRGFTLPPATDGNYSLTLPEKETPKEILFFLRVVTLDGTVKDIFHSAKEPYRFTFPALTQPEEKREEPSELELEFQLLELQEKEVVVTAAKRVQKITEAPAPVYLLTQDEIRLLPARNLSELLKYLPGVQMRRVNEGMVIVGIRGFADESNNLVLLLFEGAERNWEIFGAPIWEAEPFPLLSLSRVEVVRGPGSVLYGANAFSGVIQLIPSRPEEGGKEKPSATFFAQHDLRYHSRMVELLGEGTTGGTGYLASLHYRQEGSFSDPGETAFRNLSAYGKFAFPSQGYNLHFFSTTYKGELFSVLGETPANLESAGALWEGKGGILKGRVSLISRKAEMGMADPVLHPILPTLTFSTLSGEGEIQGNWEVEDVNLFLFGVQGKVTEFRSPHLVDSPQTEERIGVFIQDEFRTIPYLLINGGIRSDFSTFYLPQETFLRRITLSPRLSLISPITDNQSIRFSVGKAFRRPSFIEQRMALKNFQPLALNPQDKNLLNEEVTGLDLGYIGRFSPFRIGVDLFLNQFKNFIEFDPGLVKYTNTKGRTFLFGGEIVGRWEPNPTTLVFLSYGLLLATGERQYSLGEEEVKKRETFSSEPRHTFNGGGYYQFPFSLKLSLLFHYETEYTARIVNPEKGSLLFAVSEFQEIGPYGSLAFRISYPVTPHLEIGIIGENAQGDKHKEFPSLRLNQPVENLYPPPSGTLFGGENLPPRFFLYAEGRW
jgi:iron complex outermembrane receptor protein